MITGARKRKDYLFSFRIGLNGDCYVQIFGKSFDGSDGNRDSADDCKLSL